MMPRNTTARCGTDQAPGSRGLARRRQRPPMIDRDDGDCGGHDGAERVARV